MTPDEAAFSQHLTLAKYVHGEVQGKWHEVNRNWPFSIFEIPATRPDGTKDSYCFRFDLANYPQSAPTACPWSLTSNTPLPPNQWPGGTLIEAAFAPGWNPGALYLPCDRIAMQGHERWRNEHPNLWWTPEKTIALYLNELYDLLNHRDYRGPRG